MNLRNPLVLLFALLFLSTGGFAQALQFRTDVPLNKNGTLLSNAWAGGQNMGQVSKIDVNNDGKEDLFLFDRIDNSVQIFINEGSTGQVKYTYAPTFTDSFPDTLFAWAKLVDYNGDGQKDLMSGSSNSRLRVWKNTSATTGNLSFDLASDAVTSQYFAGTDLELYVAKIDFPGIYDVDSDGDLDILTFDVLGSVVEWHKNIAVDSGYGLDSLRFIMQSNCFGHFHESASSCTAILNDPPCAAGMLSPDEFMEQYKAGRSGGAHAGSTILAFDTDEDDLTDLLVGDIGCNYLYLLHNDGTQSIAHFDTVQVEYPTSFPVDIPIFPASFYDDIDNDGVKDLTLCPNTNASEDRTGMWYYKNNGSDNNPNFQFVQTAFMQAGMIDLGTAAYPAFFDYNADGLLDLLVGNGGYYDSTTIGPPTGFHLYVNTGTINFPAFELVNDDFLGIAANGNNGLLDHIVPTFADIDGDGDEDLFFGERFGNVWFYENTAGPGAQATFNYITDNFEAIDVGDFAAPTFYDIDGDLDLDLIIGSKKGNLNYYENGGDATNYSFALASDSLGMVDIDQYAPQPSDGFSRPIFYDYDQDNDVELLLGTVMGEIQIYENLTTAPGVPFTYSGDFFNKDWGAHAALAIGPLEGTSRSPVSVIGNFRGGLNMLGDTPLVSNNTEQKPAVQAGFILFPNPAQGHITIRPNQFVRDAEVRLTNALGQELQRSTFSGGAHTFFLSDLPGGVYFVSLKEGEFLQTQKFILK